MKTVILSLLAGLSGLTALAQSTESDKQAIEKQVEAFTYSWNKHDFSNLKDYTTEDLEWVNVVGMYWKNQKEVQFAHQFFHDHMFKNTPLSTNWVKIRFITGDVAIAHVSSHAGTYTTPGGTNVPEQDNIATMVFVKKQNQWLLTDCQNAAIDQRAKGSDPVLSMPH